MYDERNNCSGTHDVRGHQRGVRHYLLFYFLGISISCGVAAFPALAQAPVFPWTYGGTDRAQLITNRVDQYFNWTGVSQAGGLRGPDQNIPQHGQAWDALSVYMMTQGVTNQFVTFKQSAQVEYQNNPWHMYAEHWTGPLSPYDQGTNGGGTHRVGQVGDPLRYFFAQGATSVSHHAIEGTPSWAGEVGDYKRAGNFPIYQWRMHESGNYYEMRQVNAPLYVRQKMSIKFRDAGQGLDGVPEELRQ